MTSNTPTRTYTEALTDQLLHVQADDIPATAFDAARRVLVDAYGCALAGQNAPGIDPLKRQMLDWGGKPEARILFSKERLPMPHAGLVNSALIHALDFDDGFTPGTLHPSSVIIPALLAA